MQCTDFSGAALLFAFLAGIALMIAAYGYALKQLK